MTPAAEATLELVRSEQTVCAVPTEMLLRIRMGIIHLGLVAPAHRFHLKRCAAVSSSDGKRK